MSTDFFSDRPCRPGDASAAGTLIVVVWYSAVAIGQYYSTISSRKDIDENNRTCYCSFSLDDVFRPIFGVPYIIGRGYSAVNVGAGAGFTLEIAGNRFLLGPAFVTILTAGPGLLVPDALAVMMDLASCNIGPSAVIGTRFQGLMR